MIIAADPRYFCARTGITAVLQTWGSAMRSGEGALSTLLPPALGRIPRISGAGVEGDGRVRGMSVHRIYNTLEQQEGVLRHTETGSDDHAVIGALRSWASRIDSTGPAGSRPQDSRRSPLASKAALTPAIPALRASADTPGGSPGVFISSFSGSSPMMRTLCDVVMCNPSTTLIRLTLCSPRAILTGRNLPLNGVAAEITEIDEGHRSARLWALHMNASRL